MTSAIVHRETGEVMNLPATFDPADYLTSISSPAALAHQQALAAAYDAACKSLIGPNDVQKEGGREFKKKSAWRKLQRHFRISTTITEIHKEWIGTNTVGDVSVPHTFIATVTVRATAPWGQHAESVGACGTDEATGRRTITLADAIATAETRATNRAVSNLIAMGEVSAEEIGNRPSHGNRNDTAPADRKMPFGKGKGKRLGDLDTATLSSTVAWCREKDGEKFADLIGACEAVMEDRREELGGMEEEEGLA